jgi:hypothetical protein
VGFVFAAAEAASRRAPSAVRESCMVMKGRVVARRTGEACVARALRNVAASRDAHAARAPGCAPERGAC